MADLDEILSEARKGDSSGPARDERGRFASSEPPSEPPPAEAPTTDSVETVAESPPPSPPPPAPAPMAPPPPVTPPSEPPANFIPAAALQDERRKRQELERRLREIEESKKAAEPPKDIWEDPQGFVKQQLATVEQAWADRYYNLAEAQARTRYADYDAVRETFLEAAQNDPRLAIGLQTAPDPAEYAYREGLKVRELGAVNGDVLAYRKKVEAEVEARIRAEYEAKAKAAPPPPAAPAVPQSLNAETSPASNGGWSGPTPLKAILSR